MKFGNWNVTSQSIEWSAGTQKFTVDNASLLETIDDDDSGGPMYKWIVLATDEDWLTEDDLYDLNFAFVYAAGSADAVFNYEIFDNTLSYQFEVLDDEEDT